MSAYELTIYSVGKKRVPIDFDCYIEGEIERDHPTVRHMSTGKYRCSDHGELALILNRYWDSSVRYMRIDKVADNRVYTPRVNGANYSGHFFELRIYNRKRGYELTDLKPKDIEEIKKRWPEFQHYGVGLYRCDSSNVGVIANYFKSRNYYMEVKEYGATRKKRKEDDAFATMNYEKRTIITYFKDAFTWEYWCFFAISGMIFGLIYYLSIEDTSVMSFVIVLFLIPSGILFVCAFCIVLWRFIAVTIDYVFEPILRFFTKSNDKKE